MDDAERLRKQYENLSDSELLENKKAMGPGSLDGQIITQILVERRVLPEKQFKKTYNLALVAAVISVIGALAAWASVWYQSVQTRAALNEFRQQQAAPAEPAPLPSP